MTEIRVESCADLSALADPETLRSAGPHSRPTGDRNPNRLILLRSMSETQWQAKVREIATSYGWDSYHTRDSRGSDRGWPDLVLGHAGQRRTVFAELKKETGKLTPAQRTWLTHLTRCGFETAVWRPRDENEVVAVLGPWKQRTAWDPDGAS